MKLINDAAMQALGGYRRGRMLFLGLGTGLGSALIIDGVLEPMELAHLPYKKGRTYEEYLGKKGLKRMGKKKALIAVGHSILVIAYHVLQKRMPYQELGGDYFDRRNVDKQRKRLIRQLEGLGVRVTVEEIQEAA